MSAKFLMRSKSVSQLNECVLERGENRVAKIVPQKVQQIPKQHPDKNPGDNCEDRVADADKGRDFGGADDRRPMRVCWAGSFYRIPRSGLTHVPRAVRGCAAAQVFNNVIAFPACCWSARTSASNFGQVPSIGKRRMPSRAQRSASPKRP